MPALREVSELTLPETMAELGYLAGILDGEGWISRKGRSRVARDLPPAPGRWVIGVSNTDETLIGWLRAIGGIVRIRSGANKPVYNWLVLGRRDQIDLLTTLRPLLIVKAGRAQLALDELLSLERAA